MLRDRIRKLASRVAKTTEGIAGVLMLGLVVVNFLQVFFRYAVGQPLGWTEEFMRYSLVWAVFLAAAAALWRGEHMTIDVMSALLPKRFLRLQRVAVLTCVAVFCVIMAWNGWPLALRNAYQVSPVAEIPMIIPYGAVVAGGILILFIALALVFPDRPSDAADGSEEDGR